MDRNIYEACSDLIKRFNNQPVSADEVLAEKIDHLVPIPFKSREELELIAMKDQNEGLYQDDLMPNLDLRVLHYYATQLCLRKYPHLINRFEESSLITLGLLIEKWLKDMLVVEVENGDEEIISNSLSEGPSQFISKVINYEDAPADI
ncbi:hypothetical protein Kpol_1002p108 [Vanderwaltozyma polyspora DSM 70294]|uniref:Uncharacterized protein n=1 Tax=Vanderwaltozyma polyspora (strain ATCC 22028 / DSM 70294 / BCRC 21397 / CBS 2163 / NBRC 10782 / NRRL Y-8283 / UCD 57-17) TaxID=436907 RepID=A7TED7_VANPO|nr:uncharacterized protein Kpol_1002p108 [Vanderwaltozyma polyspora DSM 70294]EDO19459.1 hypothetical protein Kpol_1002p108 [Vanderwaltozyma polyspora DSM 70294]